MFFKVSSQAYWISHSHTVLTAFSLSPSTAEPLTFIHFSLCSVCPLTFSNPPICSPDHRFLLLSTDTFPTICPSCFSLGKLQLFYVVDLPPHACPATPPLVFSHQTPLCAAVSLVFSPHVSITVCFKPLVCLSMYLYAVVDFKGECSW